MNKNDRRVRLTSKVLIVNAHSIDVRKPRVIGVRDERRDIIEAYGCRTRQHLYRDRCANGSRNTQANIPQPHSKEILYQNHTRTYRLFRVIVNADGDQISRRRVHPYSLAVSER